MTFFQQKTHDILYNTVTNIPFPCHNCIISAICTQRERYVGCISEMGEWTHMVGIEYFFLLLRKYDTTHLIKVTYSVDYSYIFDAAIEILTLEVHALLYDERILCFNLDDSFIYNSPSIFHDTEFHHKIIDDMESTITLYSNLTEYHKKNPPE